MPPDPLNGLGLTLEINLGLKKSGNFILSGKWQPRDSPRSRPILVTSLPSKNFKITTPRAKFTKARLKTPDSDVHDSYYGINVLAIGFGLAHMRV